jgi:2-oxoisovalerate dehydrogenase E1 component
VAVVEGINAPSREALLSLYRQMVTIRRTEEMLARLHQQGLVHGACHTYVGEEAIATGVCAHLGPEDSIFSTHRGHGHALAKGVSPAEVMAELLGRDTGCARGRGGSMHLFKPEVGLLGTSGIVGPSILLAAGAAYAFKLKGNGRVAVAFFGDGASNNGAFHEGINMATIWQLPVLFVCENNQYATEIAYQSVSRVLDVSAKAAGYGLPGVSVDGNDVIAVYEVAAQAVERARSGQGPTLIECKTYRTRAHSEGMRDGGYRTQEEIEGWKARDPIKRFGAQLVAGEVATEAELSALEAEVEAVVDAAAEAARASPWPDPATVLDHVYAEPTR